MSSSLNHVFLMGYLGQDPTYQSANNGKSSFAYVSLATHSTYTSNGETVQKTHWHRLVFHGKLADVAYKYLHKGNQILIEGSLDQRQSKDKNGEYQTDTYIAVSNMQFISNSEKSNEAELKTAA